MAVDKKALDEYMTELYEEIKVNSMANTYNTISWNGTAIPEAWYKIFTQYTAKYAVKITVELMKDSFSYFVCVHAGGPYVEFVITKQAALEDVNCMALQTQLENAVQTMGLVATDFAAMEETYKQYNMGFTGFKSTWTGVYTTSTPAVSFPKFATIKPSTAASNKLNSLYEMYGMVDPKPTRYCAKHRPTVAEYRAKLAAEEIKAEAAKTLKAVSPALMGAAAAAFGNSSIKELLKPSPLLGYLKGAAGGLAGNYFTDYGKQLEAKVNKDFGPMKSSKPYEDHEYTPMKGFPDEKNTQCEICRTNDWGCCCPQCKPSTKKIKKLAKLAFKKSMKGTS